MNKNMKILLVDDFELMRFQLKKELKTLGYTNIAEATDGANAWETMLAAGSAPFEFIFCDYNMPEKNGFELLELMRKNSLYSLTPFVLVTAESEHENLVRMIRAGANDYIVKPIGGEDLRARIEKLFHRIFNRAAS